MNSPILALDLGLKRTGLAISENGVIARPLGTIEAKPPHMTNVVEEIVSHIRTIRVQKELANKQMLTLEVLGKHDARFDSALAKMCNLSEIRQTTEKSAGASSFLIGTTEYAVPLGNLIDKDEELKKLEADLEYNKTFLMMVQKKLSNESCVSKAPA